MKREDYGAGFVSPETLQTEADRTKRRAPSPFERQVANERVFGEVSNEISHARAKGFDEAHDDAHSLCELLDLVGEQLRRAALGVEGGSELPPVVRRYLVRTAATAIATIESIDRRRIASERR